ncbi:ATP-dependent endonuclease [uncultured Methanobrevibacter sp.]|uniref:ATP-dependent nuclease n=1 Tax=uncultured Methanobrevibacter sp. TaxID=253161 RepID=UPI00262E5086|nr:AAA family ATPase [uncultured Methanobrevibacter sp.]
MIKIDRLVILNYKKFANFEIEFHEGLNIIVGNNDEGKSTILEAVNLALTGTLNGRVIKNEISENIFNVDIVKKYIEALKTTPIDLPNILIELYLSGDGIDELKGNNNSKRVDTSGISFKIQFDENYKKEYESFIKTTPKSLPVEYYKVDWVSFARSSVTSRSIPLKAALIDSSTNRFQNGSDIYISRIIKENLEEDELISLSQSYRNLKDDFEQNELIKGINKKIADSGEISNKKVSIAADMSVKNSWENILTTCVDDIPFTQIGKGEQCIVKTNLALAHKKTQTANVILMEEPENHLSHSNLNVLTNLIKKKCYNKQIIVSTHSNFVANKLGLDKIILLANSKCFALNELSQDDSAYFSALPGYDTLRMILSDKAILVEGPSDELVVQKAFQYKNNNELPIEHGIDVISVRGLSFKRFLRIAKILKKKIVVITDNDGDYDANIKEKYKDFDDCEEIKIAASTIIRGENQRLLNTLEPQFMEINDLDKCLKAFGLKKVNYKDKDALISFMTKNKTEWALNVFTSDYSGGL